MKNSKILAAFIALALLGAFSACKTKVAEDVPGDFTFRGQAIHPAAVSALYRSANGQINLADFKTNLEAGQWEDQPGWWITDFEEDPVSQRSPFFAYAAFAGPSSGGAEIYILSITFNAGETDDIDNLLLLQKNGSWLGLIGTWNEGSACDGGILNQRMNGENFLYSRELTPGGLLDLALDVKLDLNAHEDLEATSESCYAAANYVYSLTQNREDLVSVRLYDEPKTDEKGLTDKFRFQSCFNRVFNAYLAEGKKALSPKDVVEFARRFSDECAKPVTPELVDK
jgi:Flp pilus assembly pilin Flp